MAQVSRNQIFGLKLSHFHLASFRFSDELEAESSRTAAIDLNPIVSSMESVAVYDMDMHPLNPFLVATAATGQTISFYCCNLQQ